MAGEILSYSSSFLNPLLKITAILLFVIAAGYLYRCRRRYGGILRQIATLLLAGAGAGIIASGFRYGGDFFTQYKWGESIFDLGMALITLTVAILVRKKLNDIVRLFEGEER